MKKLLLSLFMAFVVFSPLDLKASAQGEEISLADLKTHPTLRAPFDETFKSVYDRIEKMTGCRTSQSSLVHWLNKYKEQKLFDFDAWKDFNISGGTNDLKGLLFQMGFEHKNYDPNDANMLPKEQQIRVVSELLYDTFYKRNNVQVVEFKKYLNK